MRNVLQACCRAGGEDLAALRSRFLSELRRIVAYDAAFMAVCDPETLLPTAAFSDEPLATAVRAWAPSGVMTSEARPATPVAEAVG
jgi:hypothetical protein